MHRHFKMPMHQDGTFSCPLPPIFILQVQFPASQQAEKISIWWVSAEQGHLALILVDTQILSEQALATRAARDSRTVRRYRLPRRLQTGVKCFCCGPRSCRAAPESGSSRAFRQRRKTSSRLLASFNVAERGSGQESSSVRNTYSPICGTRLFIVQGLE